MKQNRVLTCSPLVKHLRHMTTREIEYYCFRRGWACDKLEMPHFPRLSEITIKRAYTGRS